MLLRPVVARTAACKIMMGRAVYVLLDGNRDRTQVNTTGSSIAARLVLTCGALHTDMLHGQTLTIPWMCTATVFCCKAPLMCLTCFDVAYHQPLSWLQYCT